MKRLSGRTDEVRRQQRIIFLGLSRIEHSGLEESSTTRTKRWARKEGYGIGSASASFGITPPCLSIVGRSTASIRPTKQLEAIRLRGLWSTLG